MLFGSPLRLGVTRAAQSRDSPAIRLVLGDSSDVEGCTPLASLLPCPFSRPSMASGRRPLTATPLHHKHGGEIATRGGGWKPAAQEDKPGARVPTRQSGCSPAVPVLDATHWRRRPASGADG